MWTTNGNKDSFPNYDGFPDDDSPLLIEPPLNPTPDEPLTTPQIWTLTALIVVPALALFLTFIFCYICWKRRTQVPHYLTDHFPLYGPTMENSHANTPVLGRRSFSSSKLDHQFNFNPCFTSGMKVNSPNSV